MSFSAGCVSYACWHPPLAAAAAGCGCCGCGCWALCQRFKSARQQVELAPLSPSAPPCRPQWASSWRPRRVLPRPCKALPQPWRAGGTGGPPLHTTVRGAGLSAGAAALAGRHELERLAYFLSWCGGRPVRAARPSSFFSGPSPPQPRAWYFDRCLERGRALLPPPLAQQPISTPPPPARGREGTSTALPHGRARRPYI